MKFQKYPKIQQFRNIVRDINLNADYKGKDEFENPIYEQSVKPILNFRGTVKLHGTNASVYYAPDEGLRVGKRSSLLADDALTAHMGVNQFVMVEKKDYFLNLMRRVKSIFFGYENEQIILHGEWAGQGIQKGVGVSQLPKSFYIFDCQIYNPKRDESIWLDIRSIDIKTGHRGSKVEPNIYKITDFPTYEIEIDFNNPGLVQNKLVELTNEVEKECPVAKQLGVLGTGEGIVWKTEWNHRRYMFKVKGEKHSISKVKKLASVDPEVLKNINEFVSYACTKNRIEQAINETKAKEKKDMPDLLRWMANDIIQEEIDVLKANNLEWKQVAKDCANRVRQYFFEKIERG